jgi:hypothetical protein
LNGAREKVVNFQRQVVAFSPWQVRPMAVKSDPGGTHCGKVKVRSRLDDKE